MTAIGFGAYAVAIHARKLPYDTLSICSVIDLGSTTPACRGSLTSFFQDVEKSSLCTDVFGTGMSAVEAALRR
jgi:hypothetical protein